MASRDYFLAEYLEISTVGLDGDGQPPSALNAKRRLYRAVNEMLGICKGLLADGQLVDSEITFLKEWFQSNEEVVAEVQKAPTLNLLRSKCVVRGFRWTYRRQRSCYRISRVPG